MAIPPIRGPKRQKEPDTGPFPEPPHKPHPHPEPGIGEPQPLPGEEPETPGPQRDAVIDR